MNGDNGSGIGLSTHSLGGARIPCSSTHGIRAPDLNPRALETIDKSQNLPKRNHMHRTSTLWSNRYETYHLLLVRTSEQELMKASRGEIWGTHGREVELRPYLLLKVLKVQPARLQPLGVIDFCRRGGGVMPYGYYCEPNDPHYIVSLHSLIALQSKLGTYTGGGDNT